jgi:hypothetical protein
MERYDNIAFRRISKIDFKRIIDDYEKQSIDFKSYKERKLECLDQFVSNKVKIYIDLNYLIGIRRSVLERNSSPNTFNRKIFVRLKELISEGRIICPFSETIFDEILKQSDIETRSKTAQVLDILSQGISLRPLLAILIGEFKNILKYCNGQKIEKIKCWDYPISIAGEIDFSISNNGDFIEKDLAKILFYEGIIKMTIQEITIAHKGIGNTSISRIAEKYFGSVNCNSNGLPIDKIINKEFIGYCNSMGQEFKIPKEICLEYFRNININEIREIAPSTYIFCALHSELIKNCTTKYKKNDYYDIMHCCLAIPNCDYFFTEAGFTHRTKNVLKMDEKFNIKIESNPEVILELLNSI